MRSNAPSEVLLFDLGLIARIPFQLQRPGSAARRWLAMRGSKPEASCHFTSPKRDL